MARQFRSDDTSTWGEQYGNGQDGAYAPSSSTDAPIDSACTGTADATSLSATNASFATGQVILIHQTRGTGAGNWELNTIASYSAGTITTKYPLMNTYATGAQVLVLKQYTSALIDSGVTLTAKAWDGSVGGIVGWLCSGTTTVTGTITAAGKGTRGGANTFVSGSVGLQGEGTSGAGGRSNAANGTGAGAGIGNSNVGNEGAGGGGGHAASGSNGATGTGSGATGGAGGSAGGNAGLTSLVMGGGGGSGGHGVNNPSDLAGSGGNGGGIVFLVTRSFTMSGAISCNATNGSNGSGDGGGGGGGAGGAVLVKAQSVTLGTNLATVAAGTGGTGASGSGGAGSAGRIHADYLHTISGSTTPTIDSRQDSVLADRGGSFLFNMI